MCTDGGLVETIFKILLAKIPNVALKHKSNTMRYEVARDGIMGRYMCDAPTPKFSPPKEYFYVVTEYLPKFGWKGL